MSLASDHAVTLPSPAGSVEPDARVSAWVTTCYTASLTLFHHLQQIGDLTVKAMVAEGGEVLVRGPFGTRAISFLA